MPTSLAGQDLVYQTIARHPGLTGIEIVKKLEQQQTPVHERTVRTSLFRLRRTKPPKIEIVEGRWYTREVAATVPRQRQLIEDSDGPA